MIRRALWLAWLGLSFGAGAHAAVYRCEVGGKITYADRPCSQGSGIALGSPAGDRPADRVAQDPPPPPPPASPSRLGAPAKSPSSGNPQPVDRLQCVTDAYNAWFSAQSPRPARAAREVRMNEIREDCKRRIPAAPGPPRAEVDDTPAGQLRAAIDGRDVSAVDAYLRAGGDPSIEFVTRAQPGHPQGRIPAAMLAVNRLCFDCLRRLVEAGARTDATNERGWTLTHAAVSRAYLPMVDYVLAHGGNLAAKSDTGLTPVHLAAMGLSVPVLEAVLARRPSLEASDRFFGTPLYAAVQANVGANDRLPLIRVLLAAGADPNGRGPRGSTPLHMAAEGARPSGDVEVIRMLLRANADPSLRNDAGETPLALSTRLGRTAAIALLTGKP